MLRVKKYYSFIGNDDKYSLLHYLVIPLLPIKTVYAMKTIKKSFPVVGMSCAGCSARVDKTLNKQPGIISASVNLAAAMATVEYNPEECTPEQLKEAVKKIGFDLIIEEKKETQKDMDEVRKSHYRSLKMRTLLAVVLSVPVSVIAMFFHDVPYALQIMAVLSAIVVFGLGNSFFVNAWKLLIKGGANMDTLVALSTGISYFFSLFNMVFPEYLLRHGITPHVYFEAASMIVAFILLGRTLEDRAKGNTADAIKKLMGLRPKKVTVMINGTEMETEIDRLMVGDTVVVKPGERIAVDGTVVTGESYVDESMLSGEPVAVLKEKGSKVFAGTINHKGSFRFVAEKVGSETVLAQIIKMVQEAQGSKAPVQKLVDRVAGIFVPVIISVALLSFVLWVTFDAESGLTHGFLAAVTVLVVACPCALGLATPTAIMVGIGKGAEMGILIKDADSLEIARKVDTVVLDKTGTITEGTPVATDWVWTDESEELKSVLCGLEKHSEHPLAMAVVNGLEVEAAEITGFESITGMGVKGFHGGRTYIAGNRRLILSCGIVVPAEMEEKASLLSSQGKTVIWFADNERVLCLCAIADKMKDTSSGAIDRLHNMGIKVVMLTGDADASARYMAELSRVDEYKAEVTPQQKAEFVRSLRSQGNIVAMAGDGINDSAALAEADLSIAMGKGSDIAMDVAKVTIISSNLEKIADTISLSRHTVRTIRQNLFWAFIYNIIGVPVAAGALYPINGFLLNPMIASAAMAMSSVSVVTNSLRLKRFNK